MSSLLPSLFFLRIDIECHKYEEKLAGNRKKGLQPKRFGHFIWVYTMYENDIRLEMGFIFCSSLHKIQIRPHTDNWPFGEQNRPPQQTRKSISIMSLWSLRHIKQFMQNSHSTKSRLVILFFRTRSRTLKTLCINYVWMALHF